MKCWKYSKSEIDTRVKELLEMVRIPDKVYEYPSKLSGGQKQRVAIARALAMNPSILLCDEATSALDSNIAETIMELLAEINNKLGITIVMVTHQLPIVKRYCDYVYILDHGVINVEGACKDIFSNPPRELIELVGGSRGVSLPGGGKVLNISMQDSIMDGNLIAQMAIETGQAFSILNAEADQFNAETDFNMSIYVTEDQLSKIANWLTDRNISWNIKEA